MKYPDGGQYIAKLRSGVVRTVWAADHADARRFFRWDRPVSVRKMDSAWGLMANAGGGDWHLQTEQWRQAARRWRDKYLSTPASKEEKEAAK